MRREDDRDKKLKSEVQAVERKAMHLLLAYCHALYFQIVHKPMWLKFSVIFSMNKILDLFP